MQQDSRFDAVGEKAKIKLIIQLNNILFDKDDRKDVLRIITGLPIASQNNLTHHTTCVLIDHTLEGEHDAEIWEIERFIKRAAKGGTLCQAQKTIQERIFASVPNMQQPNIPF
jgi:hypothetical protein